MLTLGDESISFEASSSLSDNFYDNTNCKVCTVRGNGSMGVTFKGLKGDSCNLRIKDVGKIKIAKISPSGRVASVQRNENAVDFIVLESGDRENCIEFTQVVSSRSGLIRQVEWITSNQIVFITNNGLELYDVNEEKRNSKLVKTLNVASDWSTCYHPSRLLLLATGVNAATMQPFIIHHGQFTRLKPFAVDFGCSNSKKKLLERDVTVSSIYGSIYVLALRYSTRDSSTSDLLMYKLSADVNQPAKLTYTLVLGLTGMFGIHVIDNLVIVHHQLSRSSLIFDIGLDLNNSAHQPFLTTSLVASSRLCSIAGQSPSLYTPSWVMFTPNVVIDPFMGIFASLKVNPEKAIIEDTVLRLRFLMNRTNQKITVLNELSTAIRDRLKLRLIQQVLEIMVEKNAVSKIPILRPSDPTRSQLLCEDLQLLSIEQDDMVHLFVNIKEHPNISYSHLASVMLAYISILKVREITVQPYLYEVLVNTLVLAGDFLKLHQLINYKVVSDSKPMAYLLVSLEAKYSPLFQSGVDMLVREGATDEIVEVLLAKGNVTDALRYLENHGSLDRANALKALDAIWQYGDRVHKYGIFAHCAEKKGKQVWNEQYEKFSADFKRLYSEEEIIDAEKEVAFSKMRKFISPGAASSRSRLVQEPPRPGAASSRSRLVQEPPRPGAASSCPLILDTNTRYEIVKNDSSLILFPVIAQFRQLQDPRLTREPRVANVE
ncbi:unnamed protein product, partial [Mesorhabditis belari]|uniref:Mic1 domain-containing protein n=1 Tax=Mesorhabditis belari TaxID=2138241 RepID=A0AAF3FS03_9BILA